MFFQIFTPIAPSSNDRRRRAIVRSAKSGLSNPRASKVDAQARVPPLSRCDLERGAELLLQVERLVAAGRADDDVEPPPVRRLEGVDERRGVAVDVDVGVDPLEAPPSAARAARIRKGGRGQSKHVSAGRASVTSSYGSLSS